MIYFFDRNISVHLARMLHHFDRQNTIIHQDDDVRFEPTDTDVKIIRTVSATEPRPVFITADVAQRRVPEERLALRESGMTVVFFRGGFYDLTPHMQAVKMIYIWPTIVSECSRVRVPTAFEVSPKVTAEKIDRLGPTDSILR